MNISLYIPCYNVSRYIGKCLDGVFGQSIAIDEVLIIDDGSSDDTLAIASKYKVKIIEHKRNKGLSAARNTALKSCSGDYIASLDADCVPEKDWLENLLREFQTNDVAGAGGMLVEGYQKTAADLWRTLNMPQHWGEERIVNPEFLFGSNNVFRKKLLRKVGSYNEKMGNNGEDYDMSNRLRKAGFNLIYTPSARAKHLRQDSVSSILRTYWNWYKRFHEPDDVSNLLFRMRYNIHWSRNRIKSDIKKKNYHLLPLEILLPFDQLGRDLSYFFSAKK